MAGAPAAGFPRRPRPALFALGPAALLALALSSLSCGSPSEGNTGEDGQERVDETPAIPVAIFQAERRPMSALYSSSATLRAEQQATVKARTRGIVERLAVEEGDQVHAGQPLAWLEDDEQRIALARAVTARDTTRRELERAEELHRQDLLADESYEQTRREAREAEHAAEEAELALSRTVLRAPFAGQVVKRHLDPGAAVSDGTEVYDLADVEPLLAEVNVPERQVAQLAIGQAVRLTADATGDVVEGHIERIAPLVNPQTGTVKVTVTAEPTVGLRPGSFVRVDVVTATKTDALVVPRSALVADGRRWTIFRVREPGEEPEPEEDAEQEGAEGEAEDEADGDPGGDPADDETEEGTDDDEEESEPPGEAVARVVVTIGYEEGEYVEIQGPEGEEAPVDVGARIVVRGAAALTDGARVEVIGQSEQQTAEADTPEDDGERT